jgi:P27 family predicted phage terminase small subunit
VQSDLATLELLCSQFDLLRECESVIKKTGVMIRIVNNGGGKSVVKNPAFTVRADAVDIIYRLGPHFCLTPKSRANILGIKKESGKPNPSLMLKAI